MTDPRRRATDQDVLLIVLAEPVIPHRRLTASPAPIHILPVQQLQSDPDPGELAVHQHPVRLGVNTVMHTPPREQAGIHLHLVQACDIVPAKPFPPSSLQHRCHAMTRHPLRSGDLPPREPLRAKL